MISRRIKQSVRLRNDVGTLPGGESPARIASPFPSARNRGTINVMTQRVTPQLRSTNWQRTRAFYEGGLGFRVDWEHRFEPGFPVFAQVSRDGLTLFLTEHAGDCQVGGAAYIVVDDVDALYQEVTDRGVKVNQPPEQTPWDTREMCIVDPDGNRLRFGQAKSTD